MPLFAATAMPLLGMANSCAQVNVATRPSPVTVPPPASRSPANGSEPVLNALLARGPLPLAICSCRVRHRRQCHWSRRSGVTVSSLIGRRRLAAGEFGFELGDAGLQIG